MKLFKLFSIFIAFCGTAQAAVWETKNVWTADSEKKFAEFIEKKVRPDIFTDSRSAYAGISTDCADAIYTLRIIFAYENQLLFAMKDPSGGTKRITSEMSRWDALAPAKRLLSFIRYVNDIGTTMTLPDDTYPVEVNKNYVTPGVVFLNTRLGGLSDMGHAEYVRSVEVTGYLSFLSSTVPETVRKLNITMVNTVAPQNIDGGFRRFKQPAHFEQRAREWPGYSNEQFRLADWAANKLVDRMQIFRWHEAVRNRLRDRVPTLNESMSYLTANICNLLQTRVGVVAAAWKQLQKQGGRCFADSGDEYDTYSTPERDTRIYDNYALLEELLKVQDPRSEKDQILDMIRNRRGIGSGPIHPRAKNEVYDMAKAKDVLESCTVEFTPGRTLNAYDLYKITKAGRLESDPNYNIAVRWGAELPERVHQDCH